MHPFADRKTSGSGGGLRPGFTLVELLVVIAILGLTVAMLVPAVSAARRLGIRTRCATNLRVIGTGVGHYSTDWHWALPTHSVGADVAFDTFMMQDEGGGRVNLGLLADYAPAMEVFYCPGQPEDRSPEIACDSAANRWRWGACGGRSTGSGSGPGGGKGSSGSGTPGGIQTGQNASFAARCRAQDSGAGPKWRVLSHTNKVIYTDFIGVDDWSGRGRFRLRLRAPHRSTGYNRLFGDGSAQWAPATEINRLRPVGPAEPNAHELLEYFRLLDVLP